MTKVEMVQGMLEVGWAPDKPPLCRVRPCHAAKMALDDNGRVPLGDCVDFVGEIATLPRRSVGATHGNETRCADCLVPAITSCTDKDFV